MGVSIHLGPATDPLLEAAVSDAGGSLTSLDAADAVVWTDPYRMRELLPRLEDRHRWVSLPVAGIDRFLTAGVIDDRRTWTSARGVYGDAVAEHAVALLLACFRDLVTGARATGWGAPSGRRLRGRTVAVLGTGGIGTGVAKRLAPFGVSCFGINRGGNAVAGFDRVEPVARLRECLTSSDGLVVAVPYTPATSALVGPEELDALGSKGVLVNVARGEIVDQEALVEALASGRLGAAGLDVTVPEPLPDDHPLWQLPNVLVTPHVANPFDGLPWSACVEEYAAHIGSNVAAFAADRPLAGTIDLTLGY